MNVSTELWISSAGCPARPATKELCDLSSQMKGSGCTCHKPALWNIMEHQNDPLKLFGISTLLEYPRSTHQDRDSRYHVGEESVHFVLFHIISSSFN